MEEVMEEEDAKGVILIVSKILIVFVCQDVF